jgi:hypothetical protein
MFELKDPAPVISKPGRSNAILRAIVLQGAGFAVAGTFRLANSIAVATDLEARGLLWVSSIVASVASDNSETMLPRVGLEMSLKVVNRRGGLTVNSSVWQVRYIVRWLRHGSGLHRQIHCTGFRRRRRGGDVALKLQEVGEIGEEEMGTLTAGAGHNIPCCLIGEKSGTQPGQPTDTARLALLDR